MCALCISDTHGNYTKMEAFIKYCHNHDEEGIHLGDHFDSFHASDEDIVRSFKLGIDNDIKMLYGNHDVVYLANAHGYFRCSGNRTNPMFVHLMETYKDKFLLTLVRDGYLLSHGGLSKFHGKHFDSIEEVSDWANYEMNWYANSPVVPESLSSIFDIGSIRGGRQSSGSFLWCSIGYEKMDKRFNQIVGHTNRPEVFILDNFKKGCYDSKHICVDTPLFHCFNTVTGLVEDFMFPEYKDNYEKRRMLERKF